MLLRKTRSESVASVTPKLFDRFPTPAAMARGDRASIQRCLKPLGLSNIRTKAIKAVSKRIADLHKGCVPNQIDALLDMPHVGRYTANALLCFAYGQRTPIVDSNVARVFNRAFNKRIPVELHKAESLWHLAYELLPEKSFKVYNWALLDLGALVCTPRAPKCGECPIKTVCHYRKVQLGRDWS